MSKYTYKYFRDNLPDWKKKKDSILVRFFFRPISFWTASVAANLRIGANTISFISMFIAIIASILYLIGYAWTYIIGAVLILIWMILDCTDGNLARCVKKEPYGEFADGASSYVLVNFLFAALGVAAYRSNGMILDKGVWVLLFLGVFTGSSDSLSRLLYQKFENNGLRDNLKVKDKNGSLQSEPSRIIKIHDRIEKEIGLNGLFLPFILLCSIIRWFDIFVIFYSCFYIISLFGTMLILCKRAILSSDN